MPRQLGDLPRRQLRKDAGGQLAALGAQTRHLVLNIDLTVGGDVTQLLDLRFKFGDGLFEIEEIDGHLMPDLAAKQRRRLGR